MKRLNSAARKPHCLLRLAVPAERRHDAVMHPYVVHRCPPGLVSWESAAVLRDFRFPWEMRPAPATEFRALHDGTQVHFRFDCDDMDLVLAAGDARERVLGSDRVELFFAADARLDPYHCFEMEPRGGVLAYRVGDDGSVTKLEAWSDGTAASVAGTSTTQRYVVVSETAVYSPVVANARPAVDLLDGSADYLVVTNAVFDDTVVVMAPSGRLSSCAVAV